MPKLTHIKRQRASDLVLRALRESILSQVFAPGERLNPEELAARLDVSLTPVKDAMTRLAAEGLVDIKPRSGTFVADLSPEDVGETFEIRAALEALAAERAASRVTPATLARLRALVRELERPVATERERLAHERLNVEFHQMIVTVAGNRKLQQLYESLNAHITIGRVHRSRANWGQRLDAEREEHREILAALDAGDGTRAAAAIRRHILRASESLVADLRERPAKVTDQKR
jgi:DNA-binding GntR family transcriptional regulator